MVSEPYPRTPIPAINAYNPSCFISPHHDLTLLIVDVSLRSFINPGIPFIIDLLGQQATYLHGRTRALECICVGTRAGGCRIEWEAWALRSHRNTTTHRSSPRERKRSFIHILLRFCYSHICLVWIQSWYFFSLFAFKPQKHDNSSKLT